MIMAKHVVCGAAALALQSAVSAAFAPHSGSNSVPDRCSVVCNNGILDSVRSLFNKDDSSSTSSAPNNDDNKGGGKFLMAQSILLSLINDEKCFSSVDGARKFADSCDTSVVYEDCYEPQPIVGRANVERHLVDRAAARGADAGFRIDKISDGSTACGFAWTWTTSDSEGLRGTTFVELNAANQIAYVREIPEPLYKPGDLILDVLKAVTADATPKPPPDFTSRTPKKANEVAKYLFNDVQGADVEEGMRFFDEKVIYRDFNYEEVLRGKAEVKKFIEDFSFPGITFATQRFDDGAVSTCFTWEVVLEGAPEGSAIKGISFYEVDSDSGLITYVRDVPESGIKPPPLGKIARGFRPALGVFRPVSIGSREGGL